MPPLSQTHIDAVLTNFSVKYSNAATIWRYLMPPLKVKKRSDIYYIYNKEDSFRIPSDAIGPKSTANEVDFAMSQGNYSVKDHGLADFVPNEEIKNADAPLAPLMDATEFVSDLLELAQEKRVSDIVFTAANYPTGNKVTLSGTDQWNDETNSNPIDDILTGLDAAFVRPNVIALGALVFTQLRKHPKVLDAVKGRTGVAPRGGIVSSDDLAALFEVEKVYTGRGRYNTAKKGQTASYTRLWGKHCALLHVNPQSSIRSVTFGRTIQSLQKTTYNIPNLVRGVTGGQLIKTVWNSDEKIVASDVGYFIENAIA